MQHPPVDIIYTLSLSNEAEGMEGKGETPNTDKSEKAYRKGKSPYQQLEKGGVSVFQIYVFLTETEMLNSNANHRKEIPLYIAYRNTP